MTAEFVQLQELFHPLYVHRAYHSFFKLFCSMHNLFCFIPWNHATGVVIFIWNWYCYTTLISVLIWTEFTLVTLLSWCSRWISMHIHNKKSLIWPLYNIMWNTLYIWFLTFKKIINGWQHWFVISTPGLILSQKYPLQSLCK